MKTKMNLKPETGDLIVTIVRIIVDLLVKREPKTGQRKPKK